jgi:hypothetical protein
VISNDGKHEVILEYGEMVAMYCSKVNRDILTNPVYFSVRRRSPISYMNSIMNLARVARFKAFSYH